MALFQRRQQSDIQPLYTMGSNTSKLVVGLGNMGKEFDGTRHNVGFACVDFFARSNDFAPFVDKRDLKCHLTSHIIAGQRVIIIKPTTLMNLSGEAVQAVQHFYKIGNRDTIVVHDELDLQFGQIRTRMGGSSAGNNGIKSLIKHCGADFGRIRIGISNEIALKADGKDFVLGRFSKDEQAEMPALYKEVNSLLNECLLSGDFPADTRSFIV
jgi:PTH1 family peptidyl-tRNA hydrolase